MANPNPIFVTPSTTIVQVDTLQAPYTPVILNSLQFPGQTVTVLNTLSSLHILTSSIVVSTISSSSFSNSYFSTLIQQPQGFLTMQTVLPNQWIFLNSYPFRDQYISAGLQTLTTSTLYTALVSSQINIISSMTVENLIVSGNFSQTAGLILNTNVSTLGPVNLFSSLTVCGFVTFSSFVSSSSYVSFLSTVSVGKNLVTQSSLQLLSTLRISTSLSALGNLSTSFIQLDGGLIGRAIDVQASTPTSVTLAGSIDVVGPVSTLSYVTIGGNLHTDTLFIRGNLSSLSSVSLVGGVEVGTLSQFEKNLTLQGSFSTGNGVSILGALELQSTLQTSSNLFIAKSLEALSTLSTHLLEIGQGTVFSNLYITSQDPVSVQALNVNGSIGFSSITSISTLVGGNISSLGGISFGTQTFVQKSLFLDGTLSTLSSFSVSKDFYVYESMSIGKSLTVSGGMTVYGNMESYTSSFFNTSSLFSTVIQGDIHVYNSLFVTDTAVISSITLPSNVLAYNFVASSMTVGYRAVTSNVLISTLRTSSLTTGGLVSTAYTMTMANVLDAASLSTFQLSTGKFSLEALYLPSTSFSVKSSFGVLTTASTNTTDINTTVYTFSNTYVEKVLSSLIIYADEIQGTFVGDGSFLSNVNFPEGLSTLFLSTGNILAKKTYISSVFTSSGVVYDTFITYSTLKVGDLNIFGNGTYAMSSLSNYIYTINGKKNVIGLNNMFILGDTTSQIIKQVIINPDILENLDTSYSLGVGGVLRMNALTSPGTAIELNTYRGDIVVGGTVGEINTNTIYVSTGIIGQANGTFFIPEAANPLQFSTNTIQPYLSTLRFNSTLIVDRLNRKVGINTVPTYTLDVHSEAYSKSGYLATKSTLLQNELNIQQQPSTFWMGVLSSSVALASNIVYSQDNGETWNFFTPFNLYEGLPLSGVATNGGQLRFTESNTLTSKTSWITVGSSNGQIYNEGDSSWLPLTTTSQFSQSNTAVAYNGQLWVATGVNTGGVVNPTLHWSSDGVTWESALSGGFTWDGVSSWYGGNSVAWNGSLWVTVGFGASLTNSILYSGDGKNWSDAQSGGFLNGGYGVTWVNSNWVATGNNGGHLSSFTVSLDGSNWLAIGGYGFATGKSIASDGSLTVAVGTYSSIYTSASIQFSQDGGTTWSNASGDLYDTNGVEGTTVVYNGSYWLAGGTDGSRKSYDGLSWFKQTSPQSNLRFNGLAYSSNAVPVVTIGISTNVNQLRFYNTPGYRVTSRDQTPNISYTSTSISFMDLLKVDGHKTVSIGSYSGNYVSSLVETGLTTVSTFVSTQNIQIGGYFLSFGNIF